MSWAYSSVRARKTTEDNVSGKTSWRTVSLNANKAMGKQCSNESHTTVCQDEKWTALGSGLTAGVWTTEFRILLPCKICDKHCPFS